MFSAYLQSGAYKGLNGRLGMEGWRWLSVPTCFFTLHVLLTFLPATSFIIDGVITIPIAIVRFTALSSGCKRC